LRDENSEKGRAEQRGWVYVPPSFLDVIDKATDNITMRDKELGKLWADRNSIHSVLNTLKHQLRLGKTRVFDLTTKHSVEQPLQKWEWPKGTWLQNRMKAVRNMKEPTSDAPRKRSNVEPAKKNGRTKTESPKQPTIFGENLEVIL